MMDEVTQFMKEHNLPEDLQEAVEVIICDAKEKVLKLLKDRGVISGVK